MRQSRDTDRMRGAAAVVTALVVLPWLVIAAIALLAWLIVR
jgi:hypothetical protein